MEIFDSYKREKAALFFMAAYGLTLSEASDLADTVKSKLYRISKDREIEELRRNFLNKKRELVFRIVSAKKNGRLDNAEKMRNLLENYEDDYRWKIYNLEMEKQNA